MRCPKSKGNKELLTDAQAKRPSGFLVLRGQSCTLPLLFANAGSANQGYGGWTYEVRRSVEQGSRALLPQAHSGRMGRTS